MAPVNCSTSAPRMMNLGLWTALIGTKKRDPLLLTVSAGLGVAVTGAAIAYGLRRYRTPRGLPQQLANLFKTLTYLASVAIWCWAFRPAGGQEAGSSSGGQRPVCSIVIRDAIFLRRQSSLPCRYPCAAPALPRKSSSQERDWRDSPRPTNWFSPATRSLCSTPVIVLAAACSRLRDTFADGQYAEAGAETFGETHNFVQHYVQAFHLETMPAWNYGKLTSLVFRNGQRSRSSSELSRKYIEPAVKEIGDPLAPGWPSADLLRQFDRISMAELLRSRGASPEEIALLQLHLQRCVG